MTDTYAAMIKVRMITTTVDPIICCRVSQLESLSSWKASCKNRKTLSILIKTYPLSAMRYPLSAMIC